MAACVSLRSCVCVCTGCFGPMQTVAVKSRRLHPGYGGYFMERILTRDLLALALSTALLVGYSFVAPAACA